MVCFFISFIFRFDKALPSLYCHSGSTSGGYSDHVFTYAAKELFGEDLPCLQYKTLRY